MTAVILLSGMWFFFTTVHIPAQESRAAEAGSPRGNLSDLYPGWLGARELLLNHRDPYSDGVTAEIQVGVWGRVLDQKNPSDPSDESRFAYPLYVVFLLAPTVMLPFEWVRILYVAVGAAVSIGSVWLWLFAFGLRASPYVTVTASALLLGSYPVVQALHLQQPALLVAGLLAAAIAAAVAGWFSTAGAFLALAMIKPQVTAPVAIWLLVWALSRWRDRQAFFLSFSVTMAALVTGAELLLPGWIWKWRDAIFAYAEYNTKVPSHMQIFFGNLGGNVLALIVVAAVCLFCWRARSDQTSADSFRAAAPLILLTSLVVNPIWHEYDGMFVLPGALLLVIWVGRLHGLTPVTAAIVGVAALAVAWQWIAAAAVSVISLVSPELGVELQIFPWLSIIFAPLLLLACLSWVSYLTLRQSIGTKAAVS